jgi:hypothetical protein
VSTGSAFGVIGSNLGSRTKYWTCSVDGVVVDNELGTRTPICRGPCNNSLFCYSDALEDGNHTLTVNATPAADQTFWLDRIEYVPSLEVSLEQKAIRVLPLDPAMVSLVVKQRNPFTFHGRLLDHSRRKSSLATAIGVSLSWYGNVDSSFNGDAFNLSWSMDQGRSNYTWNWRGDSSPNVSYPLMNQKLFETPTYPMGVHNLSVSYSHGLNYVIIQNGTVSARPVASGAIAGGVIGGVLLLGMAVLVFYLCRRRLKEKKRIKVGLVEANPFDKKSDHFALPPQTHPVQRKSRIFQIHSHFNANTSSPPSFSSSHMHRMEKSSVPHGGTHQRQHPQPIPPTATVESPQTSNRVTLGTSVIHLPPEYTPN